MRALVTGSAGFVGRHMVAELESRGWDVERLDPAGPHSYYYKKDALDYFLSGVNTRFDLTVHCAYEVGGRAHIDGKNMAFAHNLALDAAFFDWAARTNQKAVLYFSSCAAYPWEVQELESSPAQEEDIWLKSPLPPFDNYGWAKLTGERLGKAAADLGLRVHTVRPFSGYGSDQSLDYPFPSIVQRARSGDLTVWGPQGQTRDWIHIDDVVNGALSVYEADYRSPVNLCTGVGTEMGELATKVRVLAGRLGLVPEGGVNPYQVTYLTDKPTGSLYRVGDPTLMNQFYTATVSLEEGIARALK